MIRIKEIRNLNDGVSDHYLEKYSLNSFQI